MPKSDNFLEIFANVCPKLRTLASLWRKMCPEVRTLCIFSLKNVNPSENLFECAEQRQNPEPFRRNWHQKCSTPRSTKKMYFCDGFMKAKCNKNGRHIFNVFALCRLWSKTANPLYPSQKMQKMRTLCIPSPECPELCKNLEAFRSFAQKSEPFVAARCASPPVTENCEPFVPKLENAKKCDPF